ncbi:MAG TPA: molybdopterin converting factor subunit 1 [Candidatus Xenobia bacterium]|jgi:molybdopterin converting factor subunit 1
MPIQVLLFASLQDIVGSRRQDIELPTGSRVADLVSHLCRQYPTLSARVPFLRYAVNETLVGPEHELQSGDEVALMPPTSGGAC